MKAAAHCIEVLVVTGISALTTWWDPAAIHAVDAPHPAVQAALLGFCELFIAAAIIARWKARHAT